MTRAEKPGKITTQQCFSSITFQERNAGAVFSSDHFSRYDHFHETLRFSAQDVLKCTTDSILGTVPNCVAKVPGHVKSHDSDYILQCDRSRIPPLGLLLEKSSLSYCACYKLAFSFFSHFLKMACSRGCRIQESDLFLQVTTTHLIVITKKEQGRPSTPSFCIREP